MPKERDSGEGHQDNETNTEEFALEASARDRPENVLTAGGDGLTVVQDGEAQLPIVHDDDPVETVRAAVDELNYWIEQITGTGLQSLPYSEWDQEETSRAIAVGKSQLTENNGISADHLSRNGATVRITDSMLYLLGRDDPPSAELTWKGSYYAVLEFVRSLGVRWIWPGELGEVYPETETLAVSPATWEWEPHFPLKRMLRNGYRDGYIEEWERFTAEEPLNREIDAERFDELQRLHEEWLGRHRATWFPESIHLGHAFTDWYDEYYEDHPDWFAKPPGDLELHEVIEGNEQKVKFNLPNEGYQDAVFEEWHEDWQENPALHRTLNAQQNDSRRHCTRPTSRDWDEGRNEGLTDRDIWNSDESIVTERYVRFWNILAERVADVDPDVWVTGLAYRNVQEPPTVNDVESNVVIGYVGGEAYYPTEEQLYDEIQGWFDAGAHLYWRPNLLHAGHGMPWIVASQLGDDLQRFAEQNLIGADFDRCVGHWATQGLNYYVVAERMWRPEASTDEIISEYYEAFGPAETAVRGYFEFWSDHVVPDGPELARDLSSSDDWGTWQSIFVEVTPELFTTEAFEEAEEHLSRAEADVQDADEVYQDRVAFLRTGFEHSRLTAEAIGDIFQWRNNPTDQTERAARESAERLREFRDEIDMSLSVNTNLLDVYEMRYHDLWELDP